MAGCSITLLKLDDELITPVGRSRQDAGPETGGASRDRRAVTDDGQLEAWIRAFAALVAEHEAATSPSSTRRSVTPTTGSTWTAGMRARCSTSSTRRHTGNGRRAAQASSGMTLVSRSAARAARSTAPSSSARRRGGDASGLSPEDLVKALRAGLDGLVGAGQAGGSATRRCTTPSHPALDGARGGARRRPTSVGAPSTRPPAAAAAGRDATIPMVARKGRRQLPRRTQRRPPGPRCATSALLLLLDGCRGATLTS